MTLELAASATSAPRAEIVLEPDELDFGSLPIGGSLSLTVQVQNTGTATLSVQGVRRCEGTSSEYTWWGGSAYVVAPGESKNFRVVYAPVDAGTDVGCLSWTTNDPDNPTVELPLAGSGMGETPSAPEIAVVPPSLDFGTVLVGDSASQTVEVRNAGTGALAVSAINLCGGTSVAYSWAPDAPLNIGPGLSETLTVTYTPEDAGTDEGCLAIDSNDPNQGTVTLELAGIAEFEPAVGDPFRRGDSNNDSLVDISDPVNTLSVSFLGMGSITCEDAADANDDGVIDISDPVATLGYLFLGDAPPPAPGPDACGLDPTGDNLGCDAYTGECPKTTATFAGTVTNALTGTGIAGVTIELDPPPPGGVQVVTDSEGSFSEEIPIGVYGVTIELDFYERFRTVVSVVPEAAPVDVDLVPVAPVVVMAAVSGEAVAEAELSATLLVEVLDGSTIEGYSWMQANNGEAVDVIIDGADMESATVVLPQERAYKEVLLTLLAEPPVGEDELPPNVPVPEGEFPGGLQDRFQIVGLNPFSLEKAGLVVLEVEVTTTSGTYREDVEVHTELPWKPAGGLQNVALGLPVLLYGKSHVDENGDSVNDVTGAATSYDWALAAPAGSSAQLSDATTQSPYFTPDVAGSYTVTVTDTTQPPADEAVTINISAGTWQGVITGQDAEGRPLADNCTGCHNDTIAADKFTPWAQSGHAEIFTDLLDTNTHYGPDCFPCHLVGFERQVENGGADDAADYPDFLASGLLNNPGDNWTTMLAEFPETARKANVQCENCHGPQNGGGHMQASLRIDLSSDVCAVCHGEPLRHARFQQWQLSAHANYELAIDEGESGNCSRCHTANGFLTWLPILEDDDPATDPLDNIEVTWTADETHPQTCATCHDPHNPGNVSGLETNATVRISGNTPPLIAGFQAIGVGHGAICMTCHNSRRGLRNDDTFPSFVGTSEIARAPHGSAQTDVLMGQNAYLVEVGIRGRHSFVEHTCVNCHMEQTPPPDILSYNQGGTNHTFFASKEICSRCHGEDFTAEGVQAAVESSLEVLGDQIEEALVELMAAQIALGNAIDLNGVRTVTDPAEITDVLFGESRGRQSITVTFTDGATEGPFGLTDIDVVDGSSTVLGNLYDFADERVPKAGWNWGLIHNDGTLGIHNPSFATRVLDAARNALTDLAGEGGG